MSAEEKTPNKDPNQATSSAEAAEQEQERVGEAAAHDTPAADGPDAQTADNGSAPAEDSAATEDTAATDDTEESDTVKWHKAEAQAEEYLQSWQRERASFQNYKKRVERERVELRQSAQSEVLLRLLPVLDDFYRAVEAVPEAEREAWFEGVGLILRKLEKFLADHDVHEMDAQGQPFDPNFHEAVGVDAGADADPDTITQVLQRGYMQGERVLRPAMVRVAG